MSDFDAHLLRGTLFVVQVLDGLHHGGVLCDQRGLALHRTLLPPGVGVPAVAAERGEVKSVAPSVPEVMA